MSGARGHGLDLVDTGRAAERGEHRGGVKRELHAFGTELPVAIPILLTHARTDADRLADLVHEAPPGRSRLVAEHHEAPRIRPHVDDGDPLHFRRSCPQPSISGLPCRWLGVMNAIAQEPAAPARGPKLDNRRVLAVLAYLRSSTG